MVGTTNQHRNLPKCSSESQAQPGQWDWTYGFGMSPPDASLLAIDLEVMQVVAAIFVQSIDLLSSGS